MEDWGPIYPDRHRLQVSYGVRYGARQPTFGHWKSEHSESLIDVVGGQPSPQETATSNPGSARPQPGPRH